MTLLAIPPSETIMPITMRCPSCDAKMNAPDHAVGKKVRCPKCGDAVPVEDPDEESPRRGITAAPRKAAARVQEEVEEPEEEELEEVEDEDEDDANVKRRPTARKQEPANNGDIVTDLPEEFADEVLRELRRKERLIWVGQPVPKLLAVRALGMTALGVAFFMVSLFVLSMFSSGPHGAGAFILIPIIVAGVGVGMMFAPLFAYKRAQRTFYALTNRRALVWQGGFFVGSGSPTEYGLLELSRVRRRNSWAVSGAGDLVFREEHHIHTTHHYSNRGGYRGSSTWVQIIRYGFLAIDDVNGVERVLRRLIDKVMARLAEDD